MGIFQRKWLVVASAFLLLCHVDLLVLAFVRKASVLQSKRMSPLSFKRADSSLLRHHHQSSSSSSSSSSALYTTTTAIPSPASLSTFDGSERSTVPKPLGKVQAALTKMGLTAFIVSMCITLPLTLLPQRLLRRVGWIDRVQSEKLALSTGQFCARWCLRLIPFCHVTCIASKPEDDEPKPSVWVCNHTSMLDVFILLAKDWQLRGKKKRPIKIVYWKQLEDNPVTKLLFRQCGFISVDMAANKAGEANEYDRGTFKKLLKDIKQAFTEGFDIGILPEGQLNPTPEEGLLPVFPGAYTLAKMSRRPIQMMALYGVHRLWSPQEEIGLNPYGRDVSVRVYPPQSRFFEDGKEFVQTFSHVVGQFGKSGRDVSDLDRWMDGSAYAAIRRKEEEEEEERKAKEEAAKSDAVEE